MAEPKDLKHEAYRKALADAGLFPGHQPSAPEGYLSVKEWGRITGKADSTVRGWLRRLADEGKAEFVVVAVGTARPKMWKIEGIKV